jgi:pimeloyl-ACP methyl ester carboxylesterase
MPAPTFNPALSFLSAFGRFSPAQPLRVLIRRTGHKLRPPRPIPFQGSVRKAQNAAIASGKATPADSAEILREFRRGAVPTIVLGGFVPNAAEQIYLMRGFFLRSGSVYYVNYPSHSFSIDLLCAQLEDLVEELAHHGQRPVIFGVSFGAGVIMEWLKRARRHKRRVHLRGVVLISPVACAEDLLPMGTAKATTLLGRALKPYMDADDGMDPAVTQKAKAIFVKMFEAGAQNRESLRLLMTARELRELRESVIGTIQTIDPRGACQRVQALRDMEPASKYFSQETLPLSDAPTLILYAEKESSVLTERSPTRFALETAHRAYFPHSHFRVISNAKGAPVQHASLIFHCFNFLPAISAFYKHLKTGKIFKSA